ncbi:SdpI family protein [Microbacterium sp. NPDC091313]
MSDPLVQLLSVLIVGVVLLLAGIALIVLARRSRDGRVPRNQLAGVRTGLTLSSDTAWYPAQRAAAPATEVGAWGSVAGGVLVVVIGMLPIASNAITTAIVLAAAVWMLAWVIAGAARGQRAAREAVLAEEASGDATGR